MDSWQDFPTTAPYQAYCILPPCQWKVKRRGLQLRTWQSPFVYIKHITSINGKNTFSHRFKILLMEILCPHFSLPPSHSTTTSMVNCTQKDVYILYLRDFSSLLATDIFKYMSNTSNINISSFFLVYTLFLYKTNCFLPSTVENCHPSCVIQVPVHARSLSGIFIQRLF